VIDHFTLPPEAWWEEYYTPLEERAAHLARTADPELGAGIAETRREIELYRRHADSYGYVCYLLRRCRRSAVGSSRPG
jgi:serine/threonine-protein kinase HipA